MANKIPILINGKKYEAKEGQNLVNAIRAAGAEVPSLCYYEHIDPPLGTCRVCTVMVNGKPTAACTTIVRPGMEIVTDTKELEDVRKGMVEMLFAEGNHFCPACEKSGNCELQAMGYKYQMMVPRFPYEFEEKEVDAKASKLYIDRNRCILCKRCVRSIKSNDGKSIFAFKGRGHKAMINIDHNLANQMTDEEAMHAMETCPVGSILRKERGYVDPIGSRKFDHKPIGSEIEESVTVK